MFYVFFLANSQSALGFVFVVFPFFFFCALVPYSSTMPRKTRANKVPSTPAVSPLKVQLFRNERAREVYEKLNSKRKIWTERSMILDEVDPAIRANLESRGWLSLFEINHPPSTALIREFFSNLSCHIYDSNTIVRSWIRGEEFTITLRVVAEALRVPIVTDPVYPYDESPPIDEVMSHITGSSIQWGFDPRIASSVLTENAYLFLRVACHSLWPISHLHTILWSDVCFYMCLCLVLLSVFLTCFFVL